MVETIPRERRCPLRFAKVTTPKEPGQCNHAHLVCRDCGAIVEAQVPEAELGSQKGTPLQPKAAELHIAHMLFQEAAEVWLATRTSYIYGKTFHE